MGYYEKAQLRILITYVTKKWQNYFILLCVRKNRLPVILLFSLVSKRAKIHIYVSLIFIFLNTNILCGGRTYRQMYT